MKATEALEIIRSLADGVDPTSGEVYPDNSPYQKPMVIRALYTAAAILENAAKRERKQSNLPAHAGQPWSEREEAELVKAFDQGTSIVQLAESHQRTKYSITSRLVRLGKISEDGASEQKDT